MKTISKNIGIIIKQTRKHLNLSQEKLAELSELHRTYISDVERGNRNITIFSLSKIANALQIKLSELIKRAEEYDQKN